MDEREILNLYRSSDRRATAAAQERYTPFCHAIAYNILGNEQEAETCLKDVWEQAWEQFPLQPPAILSAGLGRITRMSALARRSSKKRQEESEVPLVLHELNGCFPESGSCSPEEAAQLTAAFLRRQPMLNRMIFIRRYWYFNSTAVISKQLSLSEHKASGLSSQLIKELATSLPAVDSATLLEALNHLPDDLIAEGNVRRRHLLLRIAVVLLCLLLLLSSMYPFLRDLLQR